MKKEELKKLSAENLVDEVESLKKQIFNLKLQMASGQVKNYAQFKRLRRDAARALTFVGQKKRANAASA